MADDWAASHLTTRLDVGGSVEQVIKLALRLEDNSTNGELQSASNNENILFISSASSRSGHWPSIVVLSGEVRRT
jgi:hypothetical protein